MSRGGATIDADLIARAIVAAAVSYGDDPVRAAEAATGKLRRSLVAAAAGLADACDLSQRAAAGFLHISESKLGSAFNAEAPAFVRAAAAAEEVVRWTLAGRVQTAPEPDPAAHDHEEHDALGDRGELRGSDSHGAAQARYVAPTAGAGTVSAMARPIPTFVNPDPPSGALSDRILERLRAGPGTPMGLATILDAKESAVTQALIMLRHQDLIEPGPLGEAGVRHQRWRLKERVNG